MTSLTFGPNLLRVGEAHRPFGIKKKDLINVKNVFIETTAMFLGDIWQKDYADEFENAFNDTIIPILAEGLRL